MIIQVNSKDRTIIPVGTWGTMNENNFEVIKFKFSQDLDGLNKRIVFYLDDKRVWDPIFENEYVLTNAVTKYEHVQAYIWVTDSDTEEEKPTDFRTKKFDINFFENENADGIVPTPEEVDGFEKMLKKLNEKIEEVKQLNEDMQEAETERNQKVEEAINRIQDMTDAYNANAEEKTNDFNTLAEARLDEFDENAKNKLDEYNLNTEGKVDIYNQNANDRTQEFNTNVDEKLQQYNSNASDKLENYNNNASEKLEDYNNNADQKEGIINDLADGVRNFATAIQFPEWYVNDDMELHQIIRTKLSTDMFYYNEETGDFMQRRTAR